VCRFKLYLRVYHFNHETVVSCADEPQIESGEARNPGEILDIRFQKNTNHKQKYLEAEPKILGVGQFVYFTT